MAGFHHTDVRLNLFLLLTAMLSALAGIGRPGGACVSAAVEASRVVAVAQAVAPAVERRVAERPDGYVAPAPLRLDLRMAIAVARPAAPERRRE
jgi:hypothetical protein